MALNELLTEYGKIKEQIKELEIKMAPLEERKDEIREKFADYLHIEEVREIFMRDTTEKEWKVYYRKGQKKVDHALLLEFLGQENYNKVVSQGEYIVIGNAPKKKQKKEGKTQKAPVAAGGSLPPIGTFTN